MFLDFLLSPLTDRNTFTGGVLDNYSRIKSEQRRHDRDLRRREVEALERLAKQAEEE